jgi:hypothetical protein
MKVWTFFVGKKNEKFMLSVAEVSPIIRTESPNESLDFFCGQKEREVYSGYSIKCNRKFNRYRFTDFNF